jgi:hypothetical protein
MRLLVSWAGLTQQVLEDRQSRSGIQHGTREMVPRVMRVHNAAEAEEPRVGDLSQTPVVGCHLA